MEFITKAADWIKERFSERSTWDGGVIVAVSILALIASPLLKYVAWAGLAYGAFRIYQQEKA